MGTREKKKYRARSKVQAGKKEPQSGESHEGKGTTKCRNFHQSHESISTKEKGTQVILV
jgi:hypothetical protein